jgi:hypothetical protein
MDPQPSPDAVLTPVRDRFRALATSIVPEANRLDDTGWARLEATVENALSKRPPALRRQFAIFIRLLDFLPRLRWLRPFTRLDSHRRARFLRSIQDSRVFVFRRGFWGLRTLVFMGYYGRPEAYREIGYDAQLRGWLTHPDASPASRDAVLREATHQAGSDRRPGPGADSSTSAGGP